MRSKCLQSVAVAALLSASLSAGIIFQSDFEEEDLSAWDEKTGAAILSDEKPFSGRKCLRITKTLGQDTGGDLKKWFTGVDQIYVRFYVRFAEDYSYPHHFVHLVGNPGKDRWHGFGQAGIKPDGTWFTTGIEPWFAWEKNPPPGELTFYSYFMDMEIDPKMNKYWGNTFYPPGPGRGIVASENRHIPKRGEWECWEIMLKCNTPGEANGEQAVWVNGKKLGHFTGIRWRGREDVKVNCLWLMHYGFDSGDPTRRLWKQRGGDPLRDTVWFDDVVVANTYIGPREQTDPAGVAPAAQSR